jgi:hypothetical protein
VTANRRILLYGNSVILGSIRIGLQRCSQFEVMTLQIPLRDSQTFDPGKPDIVLFDLEASELEAPFFLLKINPALVLIGISPGTNLVRVWNSRQQQEMSMQGLLELIKSEADGSTDMHDAPVVSTKIGSSKGSDISV